MTDPRRPVAAGSFYPGDPAELAALVDRLLADAPPRPPAGRLRALVVPHAGYAYSGAVAAAAFAVIPAAERGLRVALIGPSHFVPLRGASLPEVASWSTPIGTVKIDDGLREAAAAAGAVVDDEPHAHDHALEVELPFLQRRAGEGLRALPVSVNSADAAAAVIDAVAGEALIVVSTDLSHYNDDATARRLDRRTAEAVLALDRTALRNRDACGVGALRGLLGHARRAGWVCALLELRTSADASGDVDRVVGYGAFAFSGTG